MISLSPWAQAPFDLLVHAEGHFQKCEDFDRRIALISFDNAVEASIAIYLALNPIQRDGRTYSTNDIKNWLQNYHTKLNFLDSELGNRSLMWEVERSHIIWAHDQRNEQYHGGSKGTPEMQTLITIRKAAVWVFGLLYDVSDVEQRLVLETALPALPGKEKYLRFDRAIDAEYGMISIGEQQYYASELLFNVDYEAYREVGKRFCESVDEEM